MADHPLEKSGTPSASEVAELKAGLRQLQARVDRQSVVIQVLRDMLLSVTKSTEAGFLDQVAKAIAEKADTKDCRKCGKALNPKHARCMYCGEAKPADLF